MNQLALVFPVTGITCRIYNPLHPVHYSHLRIAGQTIYLESWTMEPCRPGERYRYGQWRRNMTKPLSARDILLFIIAAIIPVIIHIGWAALMEFLVARLVLSPWYATLVLWHPMGSTTFRGCHPVGSNQWLVVVPHLLAFGLLSTLGAAIASVAAALAILFLALMWNDDVPRNGYEISTWIVYPPPAICAAVILCWSSVGATLRIRYWSAAKNPGSHDWRAGSSAACSRRINGEHWPLPFISREPDTQGMTSSALIDFSPSEVRRRIERFSGLRKSCNFGFAGDDELAGLWLSPRGGRMVRTCIGIWLRPPPSTA